MDGQKNDTDYSSSVTAAEEYQNLKKNEDCGEDKLRLTNTAIRRTSSKLSMTLAKKARAEKILSDLEKEGVPQQLDVDKEGITEEERYMLRKIGLKMDAFLLLGRRGVFDGTIENMHLHWKYRELVKIITGVKHTEEIHGIARTLERESGGILVAVERVNKGYAIIVYRGKNYERPASLRPQTLLSKREALKRSLEAQRRQSLKLHVLKLTQKIDDLKLQLAKTKDSEDIQLAKDVKLGLVQEQEIESVQSTEYEMSDGIAIIDSQPYPCKPQESQVTHSTSLSAEDQIGASVSSPDNGQQGLLSDISMQLKDDKVDEFDKTKQELLPKLIRKRFTVSSNIQVEDSLGETNTSATGDDVEETTVVPSDSESEISLPRNTENNSEKARRALHLSNRERLLLRKQALKIKKRPVLAVGKSNTVIGIAKTLKTHFEKHPLAIVNVKGRAKGTSVREVVFKLEQVTGAVLVSQEPSKIILYRGWGAEEEEEPTQSVGKVNKERRNVSANVRRTAQPDVSPELISAIRLECGLLSNIEKEFAL